MIKLRNISKSFSSYEAVKSVNLDIHKGEIFGIIGPSGAGKSTLLRLMNVLEKPDTGEVEINGDKVTSLNTLKLRQARKSIGMIFQHFNLLSNKTVFENVHIALELAGYPNKERRQRVLECLKFVGLEQLSQQYPAQLSGGQKQRVAIARALANRPQVLLCDEPTSALDTSTTAEILKVLQSINQELGVTIIIVSHEMEVVKSICHRVAIMANGEIFKVVSIEPKGVQTVDKNPQSFVQRLLEEVQ